MADVFLTDKAAFELGRFDDHAVVWIAAYEQLLVQIQPLEFALHRCSRCCLYEILPRVIS